ncbi:MAG: 3-oxoacyl-ACP reductase FabG [Clostridia bacterium]|nr:3-oxoacyl-ACP reductase FabG [Clostridia bacterium]
MKTALITGASRGIGRATALKFAKSGYCVAINYNKNTEMAESLRQEIKSLGARAEIFRADISDCSEVQKMVADMKDKFGRIDVLVNNAGIALPQGLFTDFGEDDIKSVFDTNVIGMMNCTKAVTKHMVHNKSGQIVNISSVWGTIGGSCEVIYSASKAAVIGFTKALAKELAPSGIRVNCVAPGLIETDMNSHLTHNEKAEFAEGVALGRIGKAEEVAETVFFLASEAASYITGEVLSVDGGII